MQMPNNREIKINPNGWIANSDARTPASKSGGRFHHLESPRPRRTLESGVPLDEPFCRARTFTVPKGGTVSSGPITANPSTFPVKFRYEVHDNDDKVIDDPDVIIEA